MCDIEGVNMSLPESKALLLKKFVNHFCEICHNKKESSELQIHRIARGYMDGRYVLRNLLVICKDCHKKIHYKEFK